jgi:hypothetical protein
LLSNTLGRRRSRQSAIHRPRRIDAFSWLSMANRRHSVSATLSRRKNRNQHRFFILDCDIEAAAIAINVAMSDIGRSAGIAESNRNRRQIQSAAWPAVGLEFGADQEQHRADILPRVLRETDGVVGPAEAGVALLVIEHTSEERF